MYFSKKKAAGQAHVELWQKVPVKLLEEKKATTLTICAFPTTDEAVRIQDARLVHGIVASRGVVSSDGDVVPRHLAVVAAALPLMLSES